MTKKSVWLLRSVVILAFAAGLVMQTGIKINVTNSMPRGFYREVKAPIIVGSFVEVCLPEHIARIGIAHHYLAVGACDNGVEPVVKEVIAVAGDTISVQANGVYVDNKLLPHSAPLAYDEQGRALVAVPRGTYTLQKNEIWLYGIDDAKSWDSRYYGAVSVNGVRSVVKPLLVFS